MIVLASASATRHALLKGAGIDFTVDHDNVDENAVKKSMAEQTGNPAKVAEALAEAKAQAVTGRHRGLIIIGADQMLDCDGSWFDKPRDIASARTQLMSLRGRTHRLTSAVVAVRNGRKLWGTSNSARLTMRHFSDSFLDDYLAKSGDRALTSVGCYQLEGLGAQLFDKVEGDYFTILGLPLLPLMEFLRDNRELLP